jgi:serine/threonine-protein kinase RsbW
MTMGNHAMSRPVAVFPSSSRTCEKVFPGRDDQVAEARTLLAAFLADSRGAGEAILLLSELCANAVSHSRSGQPGGHFTVRARLHDDGGLHVEVEDQGSAWDGDLSTAECPHGLYLLRVLSADCGTRSGEHGWATWFSLAAPASGQAPQP